MTGSLFPYTVEKRSFYSGLVFGPYIFSSSSDDEKLSIFFSTDENNEIRASLRFKQNWNGDYRRPSSTKYKIFTAEVEKAVNDTKCIS